MTNQIDKIIRKTRGYWFSDGLTELTLAGLFALVAAFLLVMVNAQSGSFWWVVFAFGLPLIILSSSLLGKRLVRDLKERVTYPRTGYVAYDQTRRDNRVHWLVMGTALAIAIGGLLSDFLTDDSVTDLSWQSIALAEGLIAGVVFAGIGYQTAVRRFYAIAAMAAALGLAASLGRLGDVLGTVVVFGGLALALAVSGAVALVTYLRRNQAPAPQEAGNGNGS